MPMHGQWSYRTVCLYVILYDGMSCFTLSYIHQSINTIKLTNRLLTVMKSIVASMVTLSKRTHASFPVVVTSVTRSQLSPRRHASRLGVTMAAQQDPEYHILQYDYVPDILEKRDPYRAEHLDGAKNMAAQNKLVMAGAIADPVDGALFIFKGVSKEDIEAFVQKDPYVIHGLVPKYSIRPYMVVASS
jgi:uncharacterized protein YciI